MSHFINTSRSTEIEHGLVVIVDISGFTKFVFETELIAGKDIVSDLLLSIINANKLNLNIAEIEGDAVFFLSLWRCTITKGDYHPVRGNAVRVF